MKRTRIKLVSDKQKGEVVRRRQLKAELIKEYGKHCMTCKDKNKDWRGISLSHKIPLSRGGETVRWNCILECYCCHDKFEKKPELREAELEAQELSKYWE